MRSKPAMYGAGFVALSLLFFFFGAQDFRAHRSGETMIWIAALFLSIGGASLLFARHRASQQAILLKSGLTGQAVITAVRNVSFFRSVTDYIELEYRYEPSPGQAFEATSRLLTEDEARDLAIGQQGDIKFDAERPGSSAWVGRHSDRAAMPCPAEDELKRVLQWWSKDCANASLDEDELGEEELRGISLPELHQLFEHDVPDDPCMLDFYPIEKRQVARLQSAVTHVIDLAAYDYYVVAYQRASQEPGEVAVP